MSRRIRAKDLVFSRSIYAADIATSETYTEINTRIVRPRHGWQPALYQQLLFRSARYAFNYGNPLNLEYLLYWQR